MLNEEATVADVKKITEKNPKIEQALEAFFSSIEDKIKQNSDGMMDEGFGDFLMAAIDPTKNPILQKIADNKVMGAVLGVLGFADDDPPHEVSASSIAQGISDPKPGVVEYISQFLDPSIINQMMQMIQSSPMEETLENQIEEAVSEIMAEYLAEEEDDQTSSPDSEGNQPRDIVAMVKGAAKTMIDSDWPNNPNEEAIKKTVDLIRQSNPEASEEAIAKNIIMVASEMLTLKYLNYPSADGAIWAIKEKPDDLAVFKKFINTGRAKGSFVQTLDQKQKAILKRMINAERSDEEESAARKFQQIVFEAIPNYKNPDDLDKKAALRVLDALLVPKTNGWKLFEAIISYQTSPLINQFRIKLKEALETMTPDQMADQLKIPFVLTPSNKDKMDKIKEMFGIEDPAQQTDTSPELDSEEEEAAEIIASQAEENQPNLPDLSDEQIDGIVDSETEKVIPQADDETKTKVAEKAKEIVKTEEDPQAETELDLTKAEERYGEALKQFLDDEEYPVVIKFLAFLMKDQLLKEGIGDVARALGVQDTKTFGSKIGKVLTRDELKILRTALDGDKGKKFITTIHQAAGTEEQPGKEDAEDKEKKEKQPTGIGKVNLETLRKAYDSFAGRDGNARGDSFFYPADNTRLSQAKKLQDLYKQIRILLKLDIEDLNQIAAAINDDSLTSDVTVDMPGDKGVPNDAKPADTESGQKQGKPAKDTTEAPPPAKRDLYEAKKLVELRSLIILRNIIKDAELAVSEYKRVVTTGIKGSKQLASKYGSRLGQDAYNPKKVLYGVILKEIVKIANAFVATLEPSVKNYRGPNPLKEIMLEDPWDEVVTVVKQVFETVVSKGRALIDALVAHNKETDATVQIRSLAQEIYDELSKILKYYPLSKPFETDAHGAEGFDLALTKLDEMYKMVNTLTSQFQNNESIDELEQAAKVRLHDKMEELISLVKSTFAGEYDPKPSINDETSEEEFNTADEAPETAPSEAPKTKELEKYLTQEDSFYQEVVATLQSFEQEDSDFYDQNLQENILSDAWKWAKSAMNKFSGIPDGPLQYLKLLKSKIQQSKTDVESAKNAAQQVGDQDSGASAEMDLERRNIMKVHKQYLMMYKLAYEQFKKGDLDISKLKKLGDPQREKLLRLDAAKELGNVVTQHALFYQMVEQFSLTLSQSKPDPSLISSMIQSFKDGSSGLVKTLPQDTKKSLATNKTQKNRQDVVLQKFMSQAGDNIKSLLNTASQKIGNFIGGVLNKVLSATGQSIEIPDITEVQVFDTPEADPRRTADTPPAESERKSFETMIELMSVFLGDYVVGRKLIEDIVEYSKQLNDNTPLIKTQAKEIQKSARELHNFVKENADELSAWAESEWTTAVGKARDEKEANKDKVANKYKSVLNKINDPEEKQAMERILMFLTGEITSGGAPMSEVIRRIIDDEFRHPAFFGLDEERLRLVVETRTQLKIIMKEELTLDDEGNLVDDGQGPSTDDDFDRKRRAIDQRRGKALAQKKRADKLARRKKELEPEDEKPDFYWLIRKFGKTEKDIKAFLHAQGYQSSMYDRLSSIMSKDPKMYDQILAIPDTPRTSAPESAPPANPERIGDEPPESKSPTGDDAPTETGDDAPTETGDDAPTEKVQTGPDLKEMGFSDLKNEEEDVLKQGLESQFINNLRSAAGELYKEGQTVSVGGKTAVGTLQQDIMKIAPEQGRGFGFMFDALETGYNALFKLLERLYELPTNRDAVVKYLHKMHELVYPKEEEQEDPWEIDFDDPDLEEQVFSALVPVMDEILREYNG